MTSKKSGEFRYATRHLAMEKGKRPSSTKEMAPLKACKQLLKSEDWESSKFSLMPKSSVKKSGELKSVSQKDVKSKNSFPKNREKVVIVSKKSSSVRVVKSGSQKCLKGVQRSVSVKKVSYSTSVILSSEDEDESDSEEEEEEDDEEDEDDDDEEDEDRNKSASKKKDTVIKRTTSKIQTNYRSTKKIDCRPAWRGKSLKSIRDKSASKKKSNAPSRELRPRFPYSPTQEWPTARAHRMASLNALAKVHVLYENEGRAPGEAEEGSSVPEILNDDSSSCDSKSSKDSKDKGKEKGKEDKSNIAGKRKKNVDSKHKPIKRRRGELAPDVEIIDTRMCRRMASLNAQAILAASYKCEKPKRRERVKKEDEMLSSPNPLSIEIKKEIIDYPELEIVDSQKSDQSFVYSSESLQSPHSAGVTTEEIPSKSQETEKSSKNLPDSIQNDKNETETKSCFPELSSENNQLAVSADNSSVSSSGNNNNNDAAVASISSASVSEIGVTKFTKVTKVQINTTKEMEIKEESRAERKIESIVEKDDVAITRMYHYQSNSASQSYSVRMETTYKPATRSTTATSASGPQRAGPIPSSHVMGAVMPTRQSYYNYHNRPGALASQSYPVTRNMQPMMGFDQHVPRHYGNSAFSMPQYGHTPPPASYPHGEYGYYQPAGPMIQPVPEQYVVHKPVPYHPHSRPQLHQAQSPVQSRSSSCDRYPMGNNPPSHPPPFSCQSDMPMKSTHESSMAKCSDPSRMSASSSSSSPHARQAPAYSQQHVSHQNPRDVGPQSRPVDQQQLVHPVPPKHGSTAGKQENMKCRNSRRQNYASSQNIPPYSSSGYRSYSSPVYMAPHQQPMQVHPSKSQPVFRCQERPETKPTQYHAQHQPQSSSRPPQPPHQQQQHSASSMNVAQKMELPRMHDNMYSDQGKYDMKCEQYSSPLVRNVESSQNNEDVIDPSRSLWRPPLVVDIDSDSEPRNTKTYIELDVPKACPQEKIVVVDVDKEEKERVSRRREAMKMEQQQQHQLSASKSSASHPEVIDLDSGRTPSNNPALEAKESKSEDCVDSSKDTPDVMFIEMTKKKEPSALIRRAKLHGKQRTYRDSENRPLAPYSNGGKKNAAAAAASSSSSEVPPQYQKSVLQPQVSLPRLVLPKKPETRITHGWSWEGKPSEKLVYVSNDDPPFLRLCYPAIRHQEGDVIKVRDCVLLKSGARKTDLPFIAKITALWENPADGEMTMSLLWYYRPEHTEPGRKPFHTEGEIFASKHCDTNSVACIEDKCYVLTFGEYCRYRKHCKMLESTCESPVSVVPPIDDYPRKDRLPPSYISPEMVFVCRKVYDFRQKRILKNPM